MLGSTTQACSFVRRLLIVYGALCMLWLWPVATTHAQQPEPRDYELGFYIPSRTTLISTYMRQLSASSAGTDYSSQVFAMRGTYVFKVGGFTFAPLDILVPIQNINAYTPLSALGSAFDQVPTDLKLTMHATGLGDISFVQTFLHGIVENEEDHTHTWYALTVYMTTPTGRYDKTRLLNPGGNRWVFNPILVVGQRFLRSVTLEGMASATFYTKNTDYRVPVAELAGRDLTLSQKPSYSLSAHLGVDLHPKFFTSLSYVAVFAGKRQFRVPQVGEQTVVDSSTLHTLRVNLGLRVTPQTLILVQWNEDFAGSDGAVKGRWVGLRFSHVFFDTPKVLTTRAPILDPSGKGGSTR